MLRFFKNNFHPRHDKPPSIEMKTYTKFYSFSNGDQSSDL